MAGGFGGYGGSSSGSSSGFGGYGSSSGGGLTQQQMLALALAKQQSKSGSFLSDVAHGFTHGAGTVLGGALNILMRPSQAVASGIYEGEKAGDKWNLPTLEAFAHGAWAGLANHEHKTFSDTIRLKYPHFAAHHTVLTALGGLSADVLTDPTLPLIIASNVIPGVGAAADEILAARLAAELGRGADALDNVKRAHNAYDALKTMGEGFDRRKVLAGLEIKSAHAAVNGEALSAPEQLALDFARVDSQREAALASRHVFQAKYSIPFSRGKAIPLTPSTILGKRVAPLVPSLARTAEGKGLIAHAVPGAAKAASATGKVFKHGFGEEEFAKPALVATHAKDQLFDKYISRAEGSVFRPARGLTDEQRLHALIWGEEHSGIVDAAHGRALNEPMLTNAVNHGELSGPQATFLRNWHEHMNYMDVQNKAFGLKYEKEIGNKVYVPHQFNREGGIVTISQMSTKYGPGIERETDLSLRQLIDSNVGPDFVLETNPEKIMFHYLSKSARVQADNVLLNYVGKAAGVVDKVPNLAKEARIAAHVQELEQKMADVPLLGNVRGRKISISRQAQEWSKKKTLEAFARAHARIAPHEDLQFLHAMAHWAETPNVPAFSEAEKISAQHLADRVAHLPVKDRGIARQTHFLMAEERRLRRKMNKIPKGKGGPQNAVKALGKEVAAFKTRMAKLRGMDVAEVEALGKDPLGKRNMNYTERPQVEAQQFEEGKKGKAAKLEDQFAPKNTKESWRSNVEAELWARRQELRTIWTGLKKKYPTVPNVDHLKKIEQHKAAINREADKLAKDIERIKAQAVLRKAKATEEFEVEFEKRVKQYESIQRKRDHQLGRIGNQTMRNPNIPEGFIKLEKKIDGDYYHFPPELHAAMTRMEKMYTSDTTINAFETVWGKLISSWKLAVTSVNPGYRVRNTLSDLWNMYIAGVPIARMGQYGEKAAALQLRVRSAGEKLSRGEALSRSEVRALNRFQEMHNQGILSGLFQGDVQRGAKFLASGLRWRDIAGTNPKAMGRLFIEAAQDINRNVENWGRITHYLYRRDYQRLSVADSAAWVKRAHFDYTELSSVEQQKFKKLAPFYTWTRKNIPYQLTQMLSRPGKYAQYGKIARTSNELATGEPYGPDQQEGTLPSFIRNNYGFRVPGVPEGYYVPQIGVQDLAKVEHPKQFITLANPALQAGFEVATGVNAFTGQPIQGPHPRNPIANWAGNALKHVPGADIGPTSRNVRGQKVTGEGASPWVGFIASQLPMTNFLVNQQSTIRKAQRGSSVLTDLNYGTGQSVYERDLNTETIAAQLAFEEKMKKYIRGLRDEGRMPESAGGSTSAYQKQLAAILSG